MTIRRAGTIIAGAGGGGGANPDDVTIDLNSSQKLQALGTINKNTSSSTGQVFNWVGTLQEYNTQQIETLHPNWVCYVTDDSAADLLCNPFYLGQSMYSPSEPDNASWLKSNGQWNNGSVYTSFYTWLLNIYNGSITVDGVSVKADGDVSITDYDFVIDTTNTQFKLPTLNGDEDLPSDISETMTFDASGATYTMPANGWLAVTVSDMAAGSGDMTILVNDIQVFWEFCHHTQHNKTATVKVGKGDIVTINYVNSGGKNLVFMYAKGNGSLYYYVGETVSDATIITAGEALTDITNLKNATNFSDTGKETVVSWGMPDYSSALDKASLWGTDITATENGYIWVRDNNTSGTDVTLIIGGVSFIVTQSGTTPAGCGSGSLFPISVGDVYKASGGNGALRQLYFIPMKG